MYLMSMKTEELFWELMDELNVSKEEIDDLSIQVSIKETNVTLMRSKTVTTLPGVGEVDPRSLKDGDVCWEHQVFFDFAYVDVAEPDSIDQIIALIERARKDEVPIQGTWSGKSVTTHDGNTKTIGGWSITGPYFEGEE